MSKIVLVLMSLLLVCVACEPQQVTTQLSAGLHKVVRPTTEQIERLRDLGAELVVQEQDYIIIRTEETLEAVSVSTQPVQESDFVHRLVHVHLQDSTSLQKVVNTGVDLWSVENDTAIARAFDIDIRELRDADLDVRIVAQDASKWVEERL